MGNAGRNNMKNFKHNRLKPSVKPCIGYRIYVLLHNDLLNLGISSDVVYETTSKLIFHTLQSLYIKKQ